MRRGETVDSSPKVAAGALFLVAAFSATGAIAAQWSFQPVLAVSEEFNDNVYDRADDRRSDFITRLQPGGSLSFRAPAATGDLSYNFDYHGYAKGTRDDEENHYLNLRASAEVVRNFLFIDVADTLSRVSLDVTRDVTAESLYSNQTDQNRATVSPYFLWRLGEKSSLKTGYRFTDTSYWGSPGVDKREHRALADFFYDPTARLSLFAGYGFGRNRTDRIDYDQHDANAGFRYEFGERSFLSGGIGNSWQFPSVGENTSNLFWNAGVTRDFGYLKASVETRVQYTEDPLAVSTKETSHKVSLEKSLKHGTAGLSAAYRKFLDSVADLNARRKAEIGAFWRGELTPRLGASIGITGDKVSRSTVFDYAYHLNGTAGVSYAFGSELTAGLNYTYIEYRRDLESSEGARQTNRLILSLRKVF